MARPFAELAGRCGADVRKNRYHLIVGQRINGGVKLVRCNGHADSVERGALTAPGAAP